MSLIRVEQVGSNTLERAEKLLAGIPDGMNCAVKSAMSRAASHLRTNSSKEIRKVYAISAGALRSEQNIKTKYTYHPGEGVSAQVLFSGCKIPLYRYNGTTPQQPTQDKSHPVTAVIQGHWRRTYPGVSAAGHQLASTSPVRFDGGFIARMQSGHTGIFERTGSMTADGSDAIKEIMGSSVPQMLGKEEVQESLVNGAMRKFDERLDHEVAAILNGWR